MSAFIDPLSMLGQLMREIRPTITELSREREREKERERRQTPERREKNRERMRQTRSKKNADTPNKSNESI